LPGRTHDITHLKFTDTDIAERAHPALSNAFPYLKCLAFESCKLSESRNKISISMKYTAIDKLDIQGMNDTGSIILLSLKLVDANNSKYYLSVPPDDPVEEDDPDGSIEENSEEDSHDDREEVKMGSHETSEREFKYFKRDMGDGLPNVVV
jgi:hypothetical protein